MLTKDTLETNLERIHEWVKAADQKVSIFLAFQGVAVTILFSDIFEWVKRSAVKLSDMHVVLLVSAVVIICLSFYKSASAIIPRLKSHKNKKSLTYFSDIASLDLDVFKKKIKDTSKEDYDEELIRQIHISSKITVQKHSQFRDAVISFFIGIILMITVFLCFKVYGY